MAGLQLAVWGGGEGRGGNPAAMMERLDADKDGKLSGDEIPPR